MSGRARISAAATDRSIGRWDADRVLDQLREARHAWRGAHHRHLKIGIDGFPSRARIDAAVTDLEAALFPQRLGQAHGVADENEYVARVLDRALNTLFDQFRLEARYRAAQRGTADAACDAEQILRGFVATLPDVRALIDSDVEAAYIGDPAAGSVDEILICYPGALALIHHRIAHRLYRLDAPLVAGSSPSARMPAPASTSIPARRSARASSSTTGPAS